jgi:hypothetical protein
MLQVFHLDISKVDLVLQLVFYMHISCVSSAFKRMLQVFHSHVSKVDRVLHLCSYFSAASASPRCLLLLLHYCRKLNRDGQNRLTEAGKPTAFVKRSQLIWP